MDVEKTSFCKINIVMIFRKVCSGRCFTLREWRSETVMIRILWVSFQTKAGYQIILCPIWIVVSVKHETYHGFVFFRHLWRDKWWACWERTSHFLFGWCWNQIGTTSSPPNLAGLTKIQHKQLLFKTYLENSFFLGTLPPIIMVQLKNGCTSNRIVTFLLGQFSTEPCLPGERIGFGNIPCTQARKKTWPYFERKFWVV